jgi:hypothetical protein
LYLRSFFLAVFLQQQAPVFLCSFSQAVDVALVFHCLRSIIGSGMFSHFHFFGRTSMAHQEDSPPRA